MRTRYRALLPELRVPGRGAAGRSWRPDARIPRALSRCHQKNQPPDRRPIGGRKGGRALASHSIIASQRGSRHATEQADFTSSRIALVRSGSHRPRPRRAIPASLLDWRACRTFPLPAGPVDRMTRLDRCLRWQDVQASPPARSTEPQGLRSRRWPIPADRPTWPRHAGIGYWLPPNPDTD
jgi:hypothetical protein